jgi:hypothetical protein
MMTTSCQINRAYLAVTYFNGFRCASHIVYNELNKFHTIYEYTHDEMMVGIGDEVLYTWEYKPGPEPIAFHLAVSIDTKMATMETGTYLANKQMYLPNFGVWGHSYTISMRILLDSNGGTWYSMVEGDKLEEIWEAKRNDVLENTRKAY